jgi:hypothetical protein
MNKLLVIRPLPRLPIQLAALLCVFCGSAFAAEKDPLVSLRYAVNRDGERPVPVIAALDHCAWPNLKMLSDGRTLAALIFNQPNHGHTAGDVECWLSGDGGASWKFGSAATQHEPDTIRMNRMNHAAGLAASGELIVLTSGWSDRYPPHVAHTRGRFRYEVLGPWLSRSPDGGRSWWVSKAGFPQTTPSGGASVPFGDVQIANNGDLCVAAYSTQEGWEKYEERKFQSFLYRSRDDGKTWGEPAIIGPKSNETTVLHLGNGNWLASARIGSGVENKDRLLLFDSADDGRTWTFVREMTAFQHVTGNLAKLRNGHVLFCYGDRASPPGRKGIEAMLSTDSGATWSEPVRLVDWNGLDGGYPSSVERADGQVVTAYYCSALAGDPPNSYKNYHLEVIAWDPQQSFPKK